MAYPSNIPWTGIHEYLIKVGAERRIENLLHKSIMELQHFLAFESAIVFLWDRNGSLLNVLPFNITSQTISDYFTYYKRVHTSEYGIHPATQILNYTTTVCGKTVHETDFFHEFLRPNHLQIMTGVQLHYNAQTPLAQMMLFRTKAFTAAENNILYFLQPHLSNLSANLLTPIENHTQMMHEKLQVLTRRERDIVYLLSRGLSPKKIGAILQISPYTVYKHIYHIFEKLKVSNRYELMNQFAGMALEI